MLVRIFPTFTKKPSNFSRYAQTGRLDKVGVGKLSEPIPNFNL